MHEIVNDDFRNVIGDALDSLDEHGFDPVIVTDPPYNVGYHYSGYSDRMPEDDYWEMLCGLLALAPCVLVMYPEALHKLSVASGMIPERVVSWVYASNTARQHRDVAYYGVKPDMGRVRQPYRNPRDRRVAELAKRTGGARSYDWIECNQVKNVSREKTAHPCQMPLRVMELVVGVLPDGVGVVDPFCGSGTTIVACERRGIPSIGIDVSGDYCDIARRRAETEGQDGRMA